MQDLPGNINHEITQAGFLLHVLQSNDVTELSSHIETLNLNLLIIDAYEIDHQFEQTLKKKHFSMKILSFDDTYQMHSADMVLNHGIQAKQELYTKLVSQKCCLFCGSEYTLLRDEFFQDYKTTNEKNSVAIILGGNDILNLSLKVSNLLLTLNPKYKITIITTSVHRHLKQIQNNKLLSVLVDLSNIAEVLASKEFIICASGGTLFEVISLKKNFINIEVASNQKAITSYLEDKNIHTTIKHNELTCNKLKTTLEYLKHTNIYDSLDLKFSKTKLPQAILKEIQ